MTSSHTTCCALLAAFLAADLPCQSAPAPSLPIGPDLLMGLPARLVPNLGQWQSPELYRMRTGGMQLFLERQGWSFLLRERQASGEGAGAAHLLRGTGEPLAPRGGDRAHAVRMAFLDAARPTLESEQPLPGVTNFLIGDDVCTHRSGVTGYAAVLYRGMYEHVDVRVREAHGTFEYDLLLTPGADLSQVRVRVDGATALRVDDAGALVLTTALGDVCQPAPTTWSVDAGGARRLVECRYVLRDATTFGFVAPEWDQRLSLVVDPALVWSSYVGGSQYDEPTLVKHDSAGRVLVAGYTESTDFPVSAGAVQATNNGAGDGFLMLIDPSLPPASQVVWSTYIGGSGADFVSGLVEVGGIYAFSGSGTSPNLPTTPGAYQPANAGGHDAFVGVLDGTGSTLLALTYFGGSGNDGGFTSLHHLNGELYLCGVTQSSDLPLTANAFDTTIVGDEGFVAKLDLFGGSLLYSSYLGGQANEGVWAGDLDASGVLTLLATTGSIDFPTTANAFDLTLNGGTDVGIVLFAPGAATQLVYGTFVGGINSEFAYGIKRAPNGDIVVSGTTVSSNWPTTPGAYQTTFQGGGFIGTTVAGDGFVTRIDPTLSGAAALVASTYFGGNSFDQGLESDIDSNGDVTLVGWVNVNSSVPTTPGAMRRAHNANDGYVVRLSADLKQLLYGSYVGGTLADGAWLVSRRADGEVTAFVASSSIDAPMVNAFEPNNLGGSTPFLARYSLIPADTVRRGLPTPGGTRSPTIHPLDDATVGNAQFGIACTRAPANALGVIAFGWTPAPGVPALGITLFVDPTALALLELVVSAANGEHQQPLPLPATPIGGLHAQYVWIEDVTTLQLSASDALQIQ